MSPLDGKALAAIALLADRRENWAVITYGNLAKKVGHPAHFMGDVLDRVGAWCYSKEKQSLALLVISDDGKPSDGLFKDIFHISDPVTRENYEQKRLQLWTEPWLDVVLPTTLEEIDEAFVRMTATK